MIAYRELAAADLENAKNLYAENGWTAYLTDDERLSRAWEHSLYTRGAFDGEALIGFVRCVGDGAHTVLVQDLLVSEAYRGRGVGKALMQAVFDRFAGVRQVFVVTDDGSEAFGFYRACGMKPFADGGLAALYR